MAATGPFHISMIISNCSFHGFNIVFLSILLDAHSSPFVLQTTTCHTNLCYSYSWDRSEWSTCDQPDFGCGVGVMNRTIQCLRSDSEVVDDKFCFMGGKFLSCDVKQYSTKTLSNAIFYIVPCTEVWST